VIGKFTVHDNLAPHLAQGMFAKPGTYDCIMRYSSLTPKLVPDNIPAPRGIGIKIFGIEGEKIWGDDVSPSELHASLTAFLSHWDTTHFSSSGAMKTVQYVNQPTESQF
jgi:hypothetical protein